jgi:3-oxoacyl-[acyl-carrier-protein] synthase-1
MRQVAITGMGIVSCLGNELDDVSKALRDGRSGIGQLLESAAQGLRSLVGGVPKIDLAACIDRKVLRFMGDAAAYAHVAMQSAITDAGLCLEQVRSLRTGLLAGSGGGSAQWQVEAADVMRARGVRKVGPYMVPRTMCSTVHCIGAAADMIRAGRQDIVFAGGGEELHWTMSLQFDAMGALSTRHNDVPAKASRPYDADRDGFVIAGGGGMLVLEDYEHARARGARIHAVLAGYGISSDGADMVAPSGEGAVRCMQMALDGVDAPIDYLNTHGTSTPLGDLVELGAIRATFGDAVPPLSSTKALTGHSLGAASVHEAIYCLLMMRDGFIAGSANIENLDPRAEGFPIVRESHAATLDTVMSNSFGFGGTNASLVFRRDRA